MTLKNKVLAGLCSVLLIAGVSCSKNNLDKTPPDSVSTDVFWSTEAEVNSAVAGVYTRLQQNFLGYERVYLDGLSDNAFLWDNTNQPNFVLMTTGSLSASLSGALGNIYSSPYRAIASCNYFLGNVDQVTVISDAKKNAYIGEIKFLRALMYFDLVNAFGGVIIYRESPKTAEESKIPKSTKEEVLA